MIIIRAMDPYELLWMVLLIVFVLGELATIGLTCIWFAAGGAVSGIFSGIHSFACCDKTVGA